VAHASTDRPTPATARSATANHETSGWHASNARPDSQRSGQPRPCYRPDGRVVTRPPTRPRDTRGRVTRPIRAHRGRTATSDFYLRVRPTGETLVDRPPEPDLIPCVLLTTTDRWSIPGIPTNRPYKSTNAPAAANDWTDQTTTAATRSATATSDASPPAASDLLLAVNGARPTVSLAAGLRPATARLPTSAPQRWVGIFAGRQLVGMTSRWRSRERSSRVAHQRSKISEDGATPPLLRSRHGTRSYLVPRHHSGSRGCLERSGSRSPDTVHLGRRRIASVSVMLRTDVT